MVLLQKQQQSSREKSLVRNGELVKTQEHIIQCIYSYSQAKIAHLTREQSDEMSSVKSKLKVQYIVQCILYSAYRTVHIVHCTSYSVHYYSVHTTLYILQCTSYNIHFSGQCVCILFRWALYCTVYSVHCIYCVKCT